MKVFLFTLVLVAACIVGLGVNIFFRKKDFTHYDVGYNEEMRRRGIRCYKDEDAALHKKQCPGGGSEACAECKASSKEDKKQKAL